MTTASSCAGATGRRRWRGRRHGERRADGVAGQSRWRGLPALRPAGRRRLSGWRPVLPARLGALQARPPRRHGRQQRHRVGHAPRPAHASTRLPAAGGVPVSAATVTETWTPATAVSVRSGDVVRYHGIAGWREVIVREVDHAWAGTPVVITSAT